MKRSNESKVDKNQKPLFPVEDEVIFRSKSTKPVFGPGFMRRSCTFVTEGSWRKSTFGFGVGVIQKENKDKINLALKVREKAAQLDENSDEDCQKNCSDYGKENGKKVSKFVGNLKSWSSSEDVRQSMVGALAKTVQVIRSSGKKKDSQKSQNVSDEKQYTIKPYLGKTPRPKSSNFSGMMINSKCETKPLIDKVTKESNHGSNGIPLKKNNFEDRKKNDTKLKTKQINENKEKLAVNFRNQEKTIKNSGKINEKSQNVKKKDSQKSWLRHLHEAQANHNAKEGRNRGRSQQPNQLNENEDESADVNREDDICEGSESTDIVKDDATDAPTTTSPISDLNKRAESEVTSSPPTGTDSSRASPVAPSGSVTTTVAPRKRFQEVQIIQIVEGPSLIQPSEVKVSQGMVFSAEPVLTPLELLRRKDEKIRLELQEKQNLMADLLNIPRHEFETVADLASEAAAANKEPRELVLAAIFQAKRLQETLLETQALRESQIIAAQCQKENLAGASTQAAPETISKLLNISGSLSQFLTSLMVIICERDDERDRMRKELISSRERVHKWHSQLQSQTPSSTMETSTSAPHLGLNLVDSIAIPTSACSLSASPGVDLKTPNASRPSSLTSNISVSSFMGSEPGDGSLSNSNIVTNHSEQNLMVSESKKIEGRKRESSLQETGSVVSEPAINSLVEETPSTNSTPDATNIKTNSVEKSAQNCSQADKKIPDLNTDECVVPDTKMPEINTGESVPVTKTDTQIEKSISLDSESSRVPTT